MSNGKGVLTFELSMLMNDLTDEDKQLCSQLLKGVQIKFSALWQKHKGRPFNDIYKVIGTTMRDRLRCAHTGTSAIFQARLGSLPSQIGIAAENILGRAAMRFHDPDNRIISQLL